MTHARKPRFVSGERLRELIGEGGAFDDVFADEMRALRRRSGPPPAHPWPSSGQHPQG